jgi:hypothetical protein
MPLEDDIKTLESHFKSKCDGTWEHYHGIKIETTDNPGWQIVIEGVLCAQKDFAYQRGAPEIDQSWVVSHVSDGVMKGGCGINDLQELLGAAASILRLLLGTSKIGPWVD